MEKLCRDCKVPRPLSEFHRRTKSRDGRQPSCIPCYKARLAAYRAIVPPKKGGPKRTLTDTERHERRLASRKKTYEKNKAAVLAQAAIYRAANLTREKVARREHYQRNKEYVAAVTKAYREAHPDLYAAAAGKRRASKRNATPVWADQNKIAAVYARARRETVKTGELHEVDHFYPLQGENVCGLHVHENLRVVTRYLNRSKRNKHPDESVSVPVIPGFD